MTRHALAVMRGAPWHIGHQYLVNCMDDENDILTVCLGSADKPRTWRDPWHNGARDMMCRAANGLKNNLHIIQIPDLGNEGSWSEFVLSHVKKHYENWNLMFKLPNIYHPVTHYYCGGEFEASFWQDSHLEIIIKNRSHGIMSASEIRTAVAMKNNSWKPYVPWVENWDTIEDKQEFLLECMKGKK